MRQKRIFAFKSIKIFWEHTFTQTAFGEVIELRFGFRRTIIEAVCTVTALCLAISLITGNEAEDVFGDTEKVGLPILMYHSILKDPARQGKYVVSPEVLAQDLDELQKRGYETITVKELISYVNEGTPLPPKPVMITFDDGFYNNFVYAYPLLKERGMRAVVSVIGCETEKFSDNGEENAYWSYLSLDRLKESMEVFDIQNHSWNLHEYGERRGCLRRRGEDEASYENLLREDTEETQELLVEAGIPEPECYTYPFGVFSKESEKVLKGMGFMCTLVCEERMNYITHDPECLFELGRYNRPSGESTESYITRVLEG